ncbi:MAG TPA: FAD-binding oxidoreductase, partial [Candidatus Acidoferrum sp.]|nr:FAD-binding oxidoreductase [Candidatus Acidoferrum sp.]
MLKATSEEVAFDNQTRQLYATDASPYQIVPAAVAAPKNIQQAAALIQAAFAAGISVTPRGAGTGLSGGAIGDGLVIDFARHNRHIWDFNREKRTVRVGAGAVLDQLNLFLRGEGFCFGPDVATSSRATLGGMIANDSSGAHTPFYGTTGQHVNEIEIILASGKSTRIGPHLE